MNWCALQCVLVSVAPPPAPLSELERLTNPGDYEEIGKKVKGSSSKPALK